MVINSSIMTHILSHMIVYKTYKHILNAMHPSVDLL